MKKLVKTAKQRFEERLGELNVFNHQSLDLNETFYCGLNSDNQFIMLLNDGDANYMESGFIDEYEAVVTSEKFLSAMIERFNEGKREIKPLFDWYASADHEITESSPLDLRDLFNLGIEEAFYQFEDLCEEVPDVRIVTAKEQWENDSKDANTTIVREDESIRIVSHQSGIDFYIHGKDDSYRKESMPPFHELRSKPEFIVAYLAFMRKHHLNFINDAVMWVSGDLLSPNEYRILEMRDACNCCSIVHNYEDKELPQEQTIEKKDFSDRFSSLKSDIIANIGELCENGASIDIEILFDSYSIVWIDGAVSYFEDVADFSLMKTLEGHWKYGIEYGHDKGKTYDGRLELLTLESLLHILDSLH